MTALRIVLAARNCGAFRGLLRKNYKMTECLHCQINELVQQHIDNGETDVADLAAMIMESLAELILLAPESDRPILMADAIGHFGNTFLERSGAVRTEGGSTH